MKEIIRHRYGEGIELIDIRVYKIEKNKYQPERILYSFVYIVDGERVVAYDNYNKEGHHKHIKNKKESYIFENIWKLFDDFDKDVQEYNKMHLR